MARILIVVDYQNDFVIGSLGFEKAKELDAKIKARLEEAETNKDMVIFTMDTHDENYDNTVEGKNLPIKHCIENTDGWELYGETGKFFNVKQKSYPYMVTLRKNTFGSIDLSTVLKAIFNSKESQENLEVEFCGVVTNICVISNAIIAKSAVPNARIIINSKLCASNDNKLEQEAFDIMKNLHMEVI